MVQGSTGVNQADFDPWLLTWLISPRDRVRVASRDVVGEILNSYPNSVSIDGVCPDVPWAVHLHDGDGVLRLAVFDFDTGAGQDPAGDSTRFVGFLEEVGIDYVVCDSGFGGRHVWVRLVSGDPVDGRYLGRCLGPFFASLDTSAISNRQAGAVRPPGSPHRLGGYSRVIAGELRSLVEPTTQAADLLKVADLVVERYSPDIPGKLDEITRAGKTAGDLDYLPGNRRALPAEIRELLATRPAGDASSVLWRIFMAGVRAHWRFQDMWALRDSPGLEHLRSMRSGDARAARPRRGPGSPRHLAYRQWQRAVSAVQSFTPHSRDHGWQHQALDTALLIAAVMDKAGAMPGRWTGAGATQRRVLDALCLFALQSTKTSIEADIRRIAMTVGLSRETVRQGLHALAADGWIALESRGSGRVAHRWQILSTGDVSQGLPQGFPPPAGPTLRAALLARITTRISTYAHDVFTPGGLGILAGNLAADVASGSRVHASAHSKSLETLLSAGVLTGASSNWQVCEPAHLDRLADTLGCVGTLTHRAAAYILERQLWAWMCAEVEWLLARGAKPKRHRLRQSSVLSLGGQFPAYPRNSGGRLDHDAATQVLRFDHVVTAC